MRAVIVGTGAREHAIAWAFGRCGWQLWATRPNPGMALLARDLPTGGDGPAALAQACAGVGAQVVVFGPEAPLVAGAADVLRGAGLTVLGPGAAGAQLEGSKAFAKEWMRRNQLPTAEFSVFDQPAAAKQWASSRSGPPVVKADGLAGGKGVTVPADIGECYAAIDDLLVSRRLGKAGMRLVLEDKLIGIEVSAMALVSGRHFALLPPVRDYKRAGEQDRGPQTGGMGAVAPALGMEVQVDIERQWQTVADAIFAPAVAALAREGQDYRGVLYAGLMWTAQGPMILEFNVRLGDPEAQALLPLLGESFAPLAARAARGELVRSEVLPMPQQFSAAVVVAAHGYPGASEGGAAIDGLSPVEATLAGGTTLAFQGGTLQDPLGGLVSRGGRIATAVGVAATPELATALAYRRAEQIRVPGGWFRRDIGWRAAQPRP